MIMRLLLLVALTTLAACTTSPPRDPSNICAIFEEKGGWYDDAADARDEWGSPIAVMMAIMHQESRFKAKAKPPRKKIFGFIPGPRPSDAYGYSQALGSTWDGYKRSAGRYGADRDDFGDSIDFIGWYNYQSHKRACISLITKGTAVITAAAIAPSSGLWMLPARSSVVPAATRASSPSAKSR